MIRHYLEKPLFRDSVFYFVLLLVMGTVCWDINLNKMPGEPHVWRQSDCVAIAHYYAEGAPFLEPEMYCRLGDDGHSGRTIAEFPLVYYIVGKIWAVTGEQIWVFRLFNGLLCVVAMLCLYRTLLRLTNNWFWSAVGPLLLMVSPAYAYYGISFVTNITALNCVVIAWYFIARYYSETKTKQLVWATVFFSLAGLLKISSMTSYLILLFVLFLDMTGKNRFKANGKFFPKPVVAAALLIIPFILALAWNLGYVEYYLKLHNSARYSFNIPVPVWDFSQAERDHIWGIWFSFTAPQVYPSYIWILFIGAALFLTAQRKKVNLFWRIAIPLMFIGHALFALLFFFSLDAHDYYHLDLLLFFLLTYAAFVKYMLARTHSRRLTLSVRVAAVMVLTWSVLSCGNNINLRNHGVTGRESYSRLFATEKTIELFTYFHGYEWTKRPYYAVGEELTRRGLGESTVVYAVNDVSFNSLLLKMHRPGFTGPFAFQFDSTGTMWRIERGAAVMIVEDPEKETRGITQFMEYPMFQIEQVAVYDLRPYRKRLPGIDF